MPYQYRVLFMFAGVAIIYIAAALAGFSMRKKFGGREFDERQLMEQGRAYKYAFFTLLSYLVVCVYLDIFGVVWSSLSAAAFLGMLLSVGVFAVYCIITDAYFQVGASSWVSIAVIAGAGLINLIVGIIRAADGGLVEDGLITARSFQLFAGILLTVVAIVAAVKRLAESGGDTE